MNQLKEMSRPHLISIRIQLHSSFVDSQPFLKTVCNHQKQDTHGQKWKIWHRYTGSVLVVLQSRLKARTYMVTHKGSVKLVKLNEID